jgi:hypothetical protein
LGLPASVEPAQFHKLHNVYGVTCLAATGCTYSHRRNSAIFALDTKLSHLFNDVSLTLAVFVKFAATRTGGRGGKWSYNGHVVWVSPEIWIPLSGKRVRGTLLSPFTLSHLDIFMEPAPAS